MKKSDCVKKRLVEDGLDICLLAFLMVMTAYKRAKEKAAFKGSPHTLLEKLSAIRLATFIESPAKKLKVGTKQTIDLKKWIPTFMSSQGE